MKRTPERRLRLFDRFVTDLVAESGSHATWTLSWHRVAGVSTQEPGRESLRSWLTAVRGLDDPKDDVYLGTVMHDIDQLAGTGITQQRIAALRARRDAADVSRLGEIVGPDGPMSPRACFEDLAYTDLLHRDAEREARRDEVDPFIWEMVRMIGWDYAGELADIATWVQAAGREDSATGQLFAPLPPEEEIPPSPTPAIPTAGTNRGA